MCKLALPVLFGGLGGVFILLCAILPLVECRELLYSESTMDAGWTLVIVVIGVIFIGLGRHWYRRWVAAKLADKVLSDVVKAKDAFRR